MCVCVYSALRLQLEPLTCKYAVCSCPWMRVGALTNTSLIIVIPGFHQHSWRRLKSVSSPSTHWGSSSRVRRLLNKWAYLPLFSLLFQLSTCPPPPESTRRADRLQQEKAAAIKRLQTLKWLYLVMTMKTPPKVASCGSNSDCKWEMLLFLYVGGNILNQRKTVWKKELWSEKSISQAWIICLVCE